MNPQEFKLVGMIFLSLLTTIVILSYIIFYLLRDKIIPSDEKIKELLDEKIKRE